MPYTTVIFHKQRCEIIAVCTMCYLPQQSCKKSLQNTTALSWVGRIFVPSSAKWTSKIRSTMIASNLVSFLHNTSRNCSGYCLIASSTPIALNPSISSSSRYLLVKMALTNLDFSSEHDAWREWPWNMHCRYSSFRYRFNSSRVFANLT